MYNINTTFNYNDVYGQYLRQVVQEAADEGKDIANEQIYQLCVYFLDPCCNSFLKEHLNKIVTQYPRILSELVLSDPLNLMDSVAPKSSIIQYVIRVLIDHIDELIYPSTCHLKQDDPGSQGVRISLKGSPLEKFDKKAFKDNVLPFTLKK